jgi:hypothetical protein
VLFVIWRRAKFTYLELCEIIENYAVFQSLYRTF